MSGDATPPISTSTRAILPASTRETQRRLRVEADVVPHHHGQPPGLGARGRGARGAQRDAGGDQAACESRRTAKPHFSMSKETETRQPSRGVPARRTPSAPPCPI